MKSKNSYLLYLCASAIAAALILSCLPAKSKNQETGNVNARQSVGFSDGDIQAVSDRSPFVTHVRQDGDGGGDGNDGDSPLSRMPTLRIGGKEDPDVYLSSLDISVEVTGNVASTRYTMVFKNKTDRILEGELTFPLPDGRSVTHYALDINGRMREAVPVEKAKATQVFEEIQQRQVDPGILERVEGNNFRTRIYPFPARGERTISIGYEEELPLENGHLYYRLPMAYQNPFDKFSVKATVWKSEAEPLVPEDEGAIRFDRAGENYVATFNRENYRPARALIFALPAPAEIPRVMMQPASGSFYFLASVAPEMSPRQKLWSDSLAIIWDASLSGSQRNLMRELEMLEIIFAEKKNANVRLYFLNNRFNEIQIRNTPVGEYNVTDGKWDDLKSLLEAAVYDGGTDFSKIDLRGVRGQEVLFFSDGISTLSDADFVGDAGNTRPIHCIVSSSKADYSVMRLIAGKTKGKFVNANALSAERLRNELLYETPQFLGVECDTSVIREFYPSIATPLSGNFSVAGISGASHAEVTLLFGFGDKVEKRVKVQLDAAGATNQGNVHRIWAQKKIAELDLDYEKNRDELTELGQQFGIVTRNTSLIVLELVEDYFRYNIEPPEELREAYQRLVKGREERRRADEQSMLSRAKDVAKDIKDWWDRDFTPRQPRYPVPDDQTKSGARSGQRASVTKSAGGDPANMTREQKQARLNEQRAKQSETKSTSPQAERSVRKTGGERRSYPQRNMIFEAAEVIGYLDNPTPVYIIDMDDPGSGESREERIARYMREEEEELQRLSRGIDDASAPSRLASAASPAPTIRRTPIKQDNAYINQLTGDLAADYQKYLQLRNDYSNSPTFYFDMADWFYTRNDKETALRILTSIADLELENASLYRLLGYRFKEYGEYALQKFVCQKVIKWRPMDPQSYRDYALALADLGEHQAALDSLHSLLTKQFSGNISRRSTGIEEVAFTEMNRLITKYPNLNKRDIDRDLIVNAPVDVRVVINWNMDNTDIDLHVIDPHGEECYYRNRRTAIGGRISYDNTSGFGPEQFMLKKAVKGTYRVMVNYYGDNRFTDAGPSTVMAEIYTKYADKSEQRQVVCLQMSKIGGERRRGGKVEVAEFTF